MGEIADMLIDGLLDEETGELIDGDAPGYPRSPSRDARNNRLTCTICGKRCRGEDGLAAHTAAKHVQDRP